VKIHSVEDILVYILQDHTYYFLFIYQFTKTIIKNTSSILMISKMNSFQCSTKSLKQWVSALIILSVSQLAHGLENGLARTPPMGWLAWERFRCNTDCANDPHNCISERLFRQMADLVVSDGYQEVGYSYINVDDCWLAHTRDRRGRLQADSLRFPSGMKNLADYVHSKGLKFGIYEDYGNFTCAGYPGILGHLETDANTFAEWDVDYVKLDGCYSLPTDMDRGYPEFGYYLNRTGRPMLYACSWPVYQHYSGMTVSYVFSYCIQCCQLWVFNYLFDYISKTANFSNVL